MAPRFTSLAGLLQAMLPPPTGRTGRTVLYNKLGKTICTRTQTKEGSRQTEPQLPRLSRDPWCPPSSPSMPQASAGRRPRPGGSSRSPPPRSGTRAGRPGGGTRSWQSRGRRSAGTFPGQRPALRRCISGRAWSPETSSSRPTRRRGRPEGRPASWRPRSGCPGCAGPSPPFGRRSSRSAPSGNQRAPPSASGGQPSPENPATGG
mmetsp:Transcript_9773/g.34847  ORF Transcript_9773/g.34847 Transcript_9773/m.34847 type:complete len:205 (-) Transcript_9773:1062-1676(-)